MRRAPARPRRRRCLLPEYDNALLSHADRARILPPRHAPRFASANGRRPGALLVDGFVRGSWRSASARGAAAIEVQLFESTGKAARAECASEAEALLRLLEPDASAHTVRVLAAR